MARRMEPKDRDELALDDKLDVARTLVRLKSRMADRHTLNEVTALIRQSHQGEVNRGEVTSPVVPDADALLASLGIPAAEIGTGQEEGPAT